jgi:hypothetical protein
LRKNLFPLLPRRYDLAVHLGMADQRLKRKGIPMAEIHGQLLIGGLRLKDVCGTLEQNSKVDESTHWSGELLIDVEQGDLLETARPYRLELDDGRAGQLIVARVEMLPGQTRMKVLYQGTSALETMASPERNDERTALVEN